MSTIGLDYKLKNVQLENGKMVKIQVWDTAGQDRFRSITKNYYKGAHGIILIYDVTEQKSFDNVKNWMAQIKEEVSERVSIVLVGNKIDDEDNRKISTEQGESMAKDYEIMFFECSAKTGQNIDEIFNNLVKKVVENFSKSSDSGQKLKNKKKKGKGCC